ncbi:TraR/DksA C4-type zinc finger protein [Magnetospira thiophila]
MSRKDLDLESYKARLITRRAELNTEHDATEADRATVEVDQQRLGRLSRMDALQSQAMAQELERHRQVELLHIEDALKRIEEGDYGHCTACDAKIPAKRLDLDPSVPLCIKCAEKAEHH